MLRSHDTLVGTAPLRGLLIVATCVRRPRRPTLSISPGSTSVCAPSARHAIDELRRRLVQRPLPEPAGMAKRTAGIERSPP